MRHGNNSPRRSNGRNRLSARALTPRSASPTARPVNFQEVIEQGETAAEKIDLDEAATRQLIDQQLRDRGWEADTQQLRYAAGARPAKGRDMAIAEWPTEERAGRLRPVRRDDLHRRRRGEAQAQECLGASIRRSDIRGAFPLRPGSAAGGPWDAFRVPFLFAANGRPYLKQIETESGIWFRDARKATNHRRALVDWPTPEGLKGQLEIDRDAAQAALKAQPFEFGFPLRPYQQRAIEEVETGSGSRPSRRCCSPWRPAPARPSSRSPCSIGLLAAKRFRRVCFVVDRSALGQSGRRRIRDDAES